MSFEFVPKEERGGGGGSAARKMGLREMTYKIFRQLGNWRRNLMGKEEKEEEKEAEREIRRERKGRECERKGKYCSFDWYLLCIQHL